MVWCDVLVFNWHPYYFFKGRRQLIVEKTTFSSWLCNQAFLLSSLAFSGTQIPSSVHSLFFAGPTDSPSQETGWWKTKHFMGKALRLGSLTVDSCSFSFSAESLTQEWLVSFFKGALRVREKETWAERWLSIDYWSKAGTSPFPSYCCRASPFQLAHNSAMVASSTRCTKFNYFNYFLLMFMSWNSLTESSCWVGYLTVGDARK